MFGVKHWWQNLSSKDRHKILWTIEEPTAHCLKGWDWLPSATKRKLEHYCRTKKVASLWVYNI